MARVKVVSGVPVGAPKAPPPAKSAALPENVANVDVDLMNEVVLLAAAARVDKPGLKKLVSRVPPDWFRGKAKHHSAIWAGFVELSRQGLDYSPEMFRSIVDKSVDVAYLERIALTHGAAGNLKDHVDLLEWDHVRQSAVDGPLGVLVKAIQNPRTSIDEVRAHVKAVGAMFDKSRLTGKYLRDPNELVREMMADIDARTARQNHGCPYGVDGLDCFEDGTWRLIPGCAPGLITVITAVPSSGKSTLVARIALAQANMGKRVLFGAWEMKDKLTLEVIAGMSLGYSRNALMTGRITPEMRENLKNEADRLAHYIRFLAMPFGRVRGEKVSNDRNLDVIHSYVEEAACQIAIFDLWKRALRETGPDDEEHALIRQQAIAEETKTHCILVQQQRSKDVEMRPDKRPTREGIKGTGAWTEVPDTILGVHRPALWKSIDDNTLEIFVLKQRFGKWPLGVECEWNGDLAFIGGGREIPYDPPGQQGASIDGDFEDAIRASKGPGRRARV